MKLFPDTPLSRGFILSPGRSIAAAVGGGGKTTLLFSLARAAGPGTMITVTTRMFVSQVMGLPGTEWIVRDRGEEAGTAFFARRIGEIVGRGAIPILTGPATREPAGDKTVGVPSWLPAALMAECPSITAILVEADGARGLPFKVPAEHEPVIPAETTILIPVIGSDLFEGSVRELVHRPERAAALLPPSGEKPFSLDSRLTPDLASRLITHPQGSIKNAPSGAAVIPFINKCETPERIRNARALAEALLADPRIDHVVIGALKSLPDSVTLAVR